MRMSHQTTLLLFHSMVQTQSTSRDCGFVALWRCIMCTRVLKQENIDQLDPCRVTYSSRNGRNHYYIDESGKIRFLFGPATVEVSRMSS